MINKDKHWFKQRRFNYGNEETYERIYVKRFRGFLLYLLFGFESIRFLVALVVVVAFLPLGLHSSMIPWWGCFAVTASAYLIKVIGGLCGWRYTKYVVVTDNGIWQLRTSLLTLDIEWELYSWDEVKLYTDDPSDARHTKSSKLERFIAGYNYRILNATKTCSLYLKRWDGVEKIHFLDYRDVDEILSYKNLQRQVHKIEASDWEPGDGIEAVYGDKHVGIKDIYEDD